MKKGFTLIELLVVVLIIGILSAVALPQYQKTVLKSRTAEAWTNLSALNKAINVFCLENPEYSSSGGTQILDLISIGVEDSNNFSYRAYVYCSNSRSRFAYASYSKGGKTLSLGINGEGKRVCTGNACQDIGFTEFGGTPCVCGVAREDGTSCYYMN